MATIAMNVIVVGRPRIWPVTCLRWLPPNRVKSGMFSDSVDQNAIIAISDGKNVAQKSLPQPSLDGSDRIGPNPPALTTTYTRRIRKPTDTSGAVQFSNRRI